MLINSYQIKDCKLQEMMTIKSNILKTCTVLDSVTILKFDLLE